MINLIETSKTSIMKLRAIFGQKYAKIEEEFVKFNLKEIEDRIRICFKLKCEFLILYYYDTNNERIILRNNEDLESMKKDLQSINSRNKQAEKSKVVFLVFVETLHGFLENNPIESVKTILLSLFHERIKGRVSGNQEIKASQLETEFEMVSRELRNCGIKKDVLDKIVQGLSMKTVSNLGKTGFLDRSGSQESVESSVSEEELNLSVSSIGGHDKSANSFFSAKNHKLKSILRATDKNEDGENFEFKEFEQSGDLSFGLGGSHGQKIDEGKSYQDDCQDELFLLHDKVDDISYSPLDEKVAQEIKGNLSNFLLEITRKSDSKSSMKTNSKASGQKMERVYKMIAETKQQMGKQEMEKYLIKSNKSKEEKTIEEKESLKIKGKTHAKEPVRSQMKSSKINNETVNDSSSKFSNDSYCKSICHMNRTEGDQQNKVLEEPNEIVSRKSMLGDFAEWFIKKPVSMFRKKKQVEKTETSGDL